MVHRCLTVCAPFAHLVVAGAKTIENRQRRTHYRGTLLLHAGVRRSYGGHSADYWTTLFNVDPRDLVCGAIVGVVNVADCQPVESVATSVHVVGPWCWLLENPRRLGKPVPYSGKLGLFILDPFTLARVSEQLLRPFNV